MLASWLLAYNGGIFPCLSYGSWHSSSVGVGPVHIIVGERTSGGGMGVGLGTFVFFKGQTILIAYDMAVRRGCLWMQVRHLWDHGPHENVSQRVATSGTGEWTVPVSEMGVYDIIIDPSVIKGPGRGWDLDDTVWTGARR